jgi:hypothetical protein
LRLGKTTSSTTRRFEGGDEPISTNTQTQKMNTSDQGKGRVPSPRQQQHERARPSYDLGKAMNQQRAQHRGLGPAGQWSRGSGRANGIGTEQGRGATA